MRNKNMPQKNGLAATGQGGTAIAALLLLAFLLSGCTGSGPLPSPPFEVIYLTLPLLAAISMLALAYMASAVFGLHHWVPIIGDEMVQVIATGVVALLLIGMQFTTDNYLASALAAMDSGTTTGINDYANSLLSSLDMPSVLAQVKEANLQVGEQASSGIYCSMLGVGFTLSNCSPLNAFRGSLTASGFTALVGLLDVYAQQALLQLAKNYAFSLIIPLGLFFRCFKFSRQAGGALIAVGFGFYTAYPLAIAGSTKLLTGMGEPLMLEPPAPAVPKLTDNPDPAITYNGEQGVCDPYNTDSGIPKKQFNDYALALTDPGAAQGLTYLVVVKVIFLSILSMILTLGFVRGLAHILGSEIDVGSLARIS